MRWTNLVIVTSPILALGIVSTFTYVQVFFTVFRYDMSLSSTDGALIFVGNRSRHFAAPPNFTAQFSEEMDLTPQMMDFTNNGRHIVITLPYLLVLVIPGFVLFLGQYGRGSS